MEPIGKTATSLVSQLKTNEASPTTERQTSLSANSSEKLALYQASVSQIIRRAVDLYNWPALDTETLARRMAVWSETLGMTIPVERLRECFDKAVLEHEGDYPINAFELIKVWKFIDAEEEKDRLYNEPLTHVEKHCYEEHENEEARTTIVDIRGESHEIPCRMCRHFAFLKEYNAIAAKWDDADRTEQFERHKRVVRAQEERLKEQNRERMLANVVQVAEQTSET